MKAKHFISGILCSIPLILASCDGGSSSNSNNLLPTDTAASLDSTQLSTGDRITFTTSDNTQPSPESLDLFPSGITIVGLERFLYNKTAEHLFTISRSSTRNLTDQLNASLITTLIGPLGDASLNSPIRNLLRRTDPETFTIDELNELAEILNPSGTNLSVSESGDLIAATANLHTLLVNSTVASQQIGSMGGTYNVTTNGSVISFREPTTNERTFYRLFGSDFLIPTIANEFVTGEITESGTWRISLSASPF